MKRIGIFLFYNPKGKVYRYVTHLLEEMDKVLDRCIIICNGFLSIEGKELLSSYTDDLVVRPNEGFDFAAWRSGIIDVCGFDALRDYDELVLFNDSFFGPFYPFATVFDEMEKRNDVDFWGLSSHGAVERADGTGRPPYLQTYFLVMRNNVLVSGAFESYWTNLESCDTFSEHVEQVASLFTSHFEKLGFKWEAYTSTRDLESDNGALNMSHHMFNSYEMVARRHFPIIKRKTFLMSRNAFLNYSYGDSIGKTLRYIHENTDYDTSLIWEYLLDNCTLDRLSKTICLTRVVSNTIGPVSCNVKKKAALITHLYYEDLFDEYLTQLGQLPAEIDIYVTTSSEEKRSVLLDMAARIGIDRITVRVVDNRGRDVAALLVGCRDIVLAYDYVGFIHDKKSAHNQYFKAGQQFADLLTKSILGTPEYILNIIKMFEDDNALGLIVPAKPWHSAHFNKISSTYWTICYEQTLAVLSRLCLRVPMSRSDDCTAIGSAFWFRTEAMRPLFEEQWTSEDFLGEPLPTDGSISHGIERCFPFVGQSQGFYTLTVLPYDLAERALYDYRYMLDSTVHAISSNKCIKLKDTTDYRTYQLSLNTFVVKHMNSRLRKKLKAKYNRIKTKSPSVQKVNRFIKRNFKYFWNRI